MKSNITQEFLESCTDLQIDRGIAWIQAKSMDAGWLRYSSTNDAFIEEDDECMSINCICYCTYPNDAWTIIESSRINLISPPEHRQHWKACATIGGGNWSLNDFTATSKNPLRAAMIVFILLSIGEK